MTPEERKELRAQHVPTYVDTWAAMFNFKRGIQSADVCACGCVSLADALDEVEAERDALLEMFGLRGIES